MSTFFVADKSFYKARTYTTAELLAVNPSINELKKRSNNSTTSISAEHRASLFQLYGA
jgi:hypothetical protein